ncbi:MAG: M23 family metallopeptidase [Proteobacteria bacterium]|nr:M23 family metallopeptidase [Pseudomonadota bacterium]
MNTRTLRWLLIAGVMFTALASSARVQAEPRQTDLAVYVARVKGLYSEAEVTGRFYDWRAVSQYRSSAGLHLGYDIALNAGRQVPAGWPGRVVGIIPWTDSEFGVCVEVAGGYRVTYGHLYPQVHEGDSIAAGQFVGTVAHDHVDIKVKNSAGGYIDWGGTVGVLDGSSPWAASGSAGLLPPPPWMNGGRLPSGLGPDALVERYRALATDLATREADRDHLREAVRTLSSFMSLESEGLPQAESQMLAWYRAVDSNKVSEAQVEALDLTVKSRRSRVTRLGYMLAGRQRDLSEREAACKTAESAVDSTREAALKAGATEDRLSTVEREARKAGRAKVKIESSPSLDQRVQEAENRLAALKSRYPSTCSKTDLDEAQKTLLRLRAARGLYEVGDRSDAHELNW